jgi:hypothetical protein
MIRYVDLCVLGAISVFLIYSPALAVAVEPRPATLTTRELQRRLINANARVRAWCVEYESARKTLTGKLEESYVHRKVAAKAPNQLLIWNAHGTPWLDWRDDPFQQRLVLNSGTAIHDWVFDRKFRSWPWASDGLLPGSANQEFSFLILGWWPFNKTRTPTLGDMPVSFPALARSLNYVVNPWQEFIKGRWCHILEYPGRDKWWLDCERNCTIVARELYYPKNGLRWQRIETSQYRQIQPGIWAPLEFRNMIFNTSMRNPEDAKEVTLLDATFKILDVRLNEQVRDELFRFKPLPGSIQFTKQGVFKQEFPGAADCFDNIIAWTQKHYELSSSSSHDTGFTIEAILEYTIIVSGIVAIIFRVFLPVEKEKLAGVLCLKAA